MSVEESTRSAGAQLPDFKTQETEGLESGDKVFADLAIAYMLGMGYIVARGFYDTHLKEHFSEGYQEHRRQSKEPTTVWRWLGKGVMKRVDAMKNWDPH